MELYQLRQFAAAARLENMTRAAQELNVAQPAVSKTIRHLENELGVELFERTGKGLRRTEAGDILLRYAQQILQAEEDARREIAESAQQAGSLCICALSLSEQIGEILSGFTRVCGDIRFRVTTTPEQSDLLLDSAVSHEEIPADAELLGSEEICLAVPSSHQLAGQEAVALSELTEDSFIVLRNSHSFRQVSEHIFRATGLNPRITIECDNAALQNQMISLGMGVALVASNAWQHAQQNNDIRLLHIRDADCRRYLYMRTLSRYQTRGMRDFKAYLRRFFTDIQAQAQTSSGTVSPS